MGVSWKKDERSPLVDVDLCETCEQHICKDCALRDSLQDRVEKLETELDEQGDILRGQIADNAKLRNRWAELRRQVSAENPMHGCFADITDWMDELEDK